MIRISSKTRFCQLLLLLGIAALVVAGAATAQEPGMRRGGGPGGPGGRPDNAELTARLAQRLSLTDEQQKQVLAIYEERSKAAMEEMQKARESGADREEMRAQMLEFRTKNDKKIEAVLDEKQLAEYRELREERDQTMQKRRTERGSREGRRGAEGLSEPPASGAPAPTE